MIVCFNSTKGEKLVLGDSWKEILFVSSGAGDKVRAMLNGVWKGDGVVVTDENEDLRTDHAKTVEATGKPAKYYTYDRDYVESGDGAVYGVYKDGSVQRFDTLIYLLSRDMPDTFRVNHYYWLEGLWGNAPIEATDTEPKGKDITCDWDIEGFHVRASDDEIKKLVKDEDIPDDGLWAVDILGLSDVE